MNKVFKLFCFIIGFSFDKHYHWITDKDGHKNYTLICLGATKDRKSNRRVYRFIFFWFVIAIIKYK